MVNRTKRLAPIIHSDSDGLSPRDRRRQEWVAKSPSSKWEITRSSEPYGAATTTWALYVLRIQDIQTG